MILLITMYSYLIIIFFFIGKITLWVSLGFFLLYGFYVAMVITQSKKVKVDDAGNDRTVSVAINAKEFINHAA